MLIKNFRIPLWLAIAWLTFHFQACSDKRGGDREDHQVIENMWIPLETLDEGGLVGERVDAWRDKRLWYIAESGYLIDGFEHRPGVHPWQGEHLGKWLHATTLAYRVTGDERIKQEMDTLVERLIATQLPNGYLGTYTEENRFTAVPENMDSKALADDTYTSVEKEAIRRHLQSNMGGWDTWTHRYNLYGLLTYEHYFPDDRIVEACRKMADLLIDTYGEGKHDLTKYGTRQGISATTLLESIVMLYDRTGEEKYLDFVEHIIEMSEHNPGLRLMDAMLNNESVVYPGDGKGYQLMSNLLGYLRLYEATGREDYLTTVLNGWQEIHDKHLLVTGGPWTRHMSYNGNSECFAFTEAFDPAISHVENCCTVTWMQLNIHLFELTGEARYFQETELSLLNDLYGHQHRDGIDWCYFTAPNDADPQFDPRFSCCASSGPRGLEMFSDHLAGEIGGRLSINSFAPASIALPDEFGGGKLLIGSKYPFGSSTQVTFQTDRSRTYPVEFRLPKSTHLKKVEINGEETDVLENDRGFFELSHRWRKGDVLTVEMQYELELHVQRGEDGQQWIAFTYGPLVLAQDITGLPGEEPFEGSGMDPDQPGTILSLLKWSGASNNEFVFKIQASGVVLEPYYLTFDRGTGPKTYFKINPLNPIDEKNH